MLKINTIKGHGGFNKVFLPICKVLAPGCHENLSGKKIIRLFENCKDSCSIQKKGLPQILKTMD